MPDVTDALELLQVHHSYAHPSGERSIDLLRNVNYTIARGEVQALLGRSGSGKTTLLHILGGLLRPSHGQVLWNGQEVTALSDARRTRNRLGVVSFVFQDAHLLPELTVMQNVQLAGRLAGHPNPERAYEMLALVGLAGRAGDNVQALSGGEKQRVAIARALHAKPSFVLADEPTARLDGATAEGVMQVFLEVVKTTNVGVLFATHDPARKADADRVWTLEGGQLHELKGAS